MKIVITGFANTMSKPQRIAGYVYLPFHIVVIPLFLGMLAMYLPGGLNDATLNIILYGTGLAFCLICMWKYLRSAFDTLLDNLAVNISALCFGYVINILLSYLATGVLFAILGDKITNPNNAEVINLASESPRAVIAIAVFIAPIVEEILFRGVIFGSLQQRHRRLAIFVSIALFAFYHVWQYALGSMDVSVLWYMISYIPAGYALAWVYEKTNSIWVPIFLHMLNNGISLLFLS